MNEGLPSSQTTTYDIVKRLLDIVGAVVGIVLLSPLFAVIALAIRVSSPGPVFFRQVRVGAGGEHFTLLKFRTMQIGGDETIHRDYMAELVRGEAKSRTNEEGEQVYLLDDPRVTSVGRLLRTTSIDELPNLFNVLKGDMSLVGPRPPIPYEVDLYDERALRRLSVKPGMTGLSQVRGRGSLTFQEMVDFDLEYIDNRSISLDLRILVETVPRVLQRRGV